MPQKTLYIPFRAPNIPYILEYFRVDWQYIKKYWEHFGAYSVYFMFYWISWEYIWVCWECFGIFGIIVCTLRVLWVMLDILRLHSGMFKEPWHIFWRTFGYIWCILRIFWFSQEYFRVYQECIWNMLGLGGSTYGYVVITYENVLEYQQLFAWI